MPAGVEEWHLVRPALVVADPALMASLPEQPLAATAMNALAHASESLYAPGANPSPRARRCERRSCSRTRSRRGALDRDALALASLLGGLRDRHHRASPCTTRSARRSCAPQGTPHAQTNAVMLPHTPALHGAAGARTRCGGWLGHWGSAGEDPAEAAAAVEPLAARSGATSLADIGLDAGRVARNRATLPSSTRSSPRWRLRRTQGQLRALLEAAL